VLLLPGFGAGDGSLAPLRTYLRLLGHRAEGWGLGRNQGDVPELLPRVAERVGHLVREEGGPIDLVGWSLGGVLAREAAREHPSCVRRIVTLGSPVIGGPKYTAVADAYRLRGVDLDAIEAEVEQRNRSPLEASVTAVYSRRDGVVAWRACIDPCGSRTEHVEVDTTHLGLGFSPEVYEIIAARLAAPDERAV
jgi:pimeloyl-ACP methyl ester carboxylesterase